jgi:hypothetical protein
MNPAKREFEGGYVFPQRKSMKGLVFGISQSGKSTFALALALSFRKQLIIWDANEVFIGVVKSPVYTLGDLQDAIEKKEPIIVYDASGVGDKPTEFEDFAKVLEQYDGHTLLIDESGDIQRATGPNHGLDRLLRRAGRRGNDVIETTHRPADIATLNRQLTTDVFLFFMWNKKGLKSVTDEFGENVAEAEAALPPDGYAFIHLDPHTGNFVVVDEPEAWYINLDEEIVLPKDSIDLPEKTRRSLFEESIYG